MSVHLVLPPQHRLRHRLCVVCDEVQLRAGDRRRCRIVARSQRTPTKTPGTRRAECRVRRDLDVYRPTSTATFSPSRAWAATDSQSAAYKMAPQPRPDGRPHRAAARSPAASGQRRRRPSDVDAEVDPRSGERRLIAPASDDFPDRGAPFRMMTCPLDAPPCTAIILLRRRPRGPAGATASSRRYVPSDGGAQESLADSTRVGAASDGRSDRACVAESGQPGSSGGLVGAAVSRQASARALRQGSLRLAIAVTIASGVRVLVDHWLGRSTALGFYIVGAALLAVAFSTSAGMSGRMGGRYMYHGVGGRERRFNLGIAYIGAGAVVIAIGVVIEAVAGR